MATSCPLVCASPLRSVPADGTCLCLFSLGCCPVDCSRAYDRSNFLSWCSVVDAEPPPPVSSCSSPLLSINSFSLLPRRFTRYPSSLRQLDSFVAPFLRSSCCAYSRISQHQSPPFTIQPRPSRTLAICVQRLSAFSPSFFKRSSWPSRCLTHNSLYSSASESPTAFQYPSYNTTTFFGFCSIRFFPLSYRQLFYFFSREQLLTYSTAHLHKERRAVSTFYAQASPASLSFHQFGMYYHLLPPLCVFLSLLCWHYLRRSFPCPCIIMPSSSVPIPCEFHVKITWILPEPAGRASNQVAPSLHQASSFT